MSHRPVSDLLSRIEAALEQLPRRQAEVFVAHRVYDMSYGEIAERTALTVRQVERRMSKAIYKLAKQLDGRKLSWWERHF